MTLDLNPRKNTVFILVILLLSSLRSGDLETTGISLNSGPFAPPAVPALFIDYLVQLPRQRPPRAPTVAGTVRKEAGRRCFFSPQRQSVLSIRQFTGRCETLRACQSDGCSRCAGLADAGATLGRACCRLGAGR